MKITQNIKEVLGTLKRRKPAKIYCHAVEARTSTCQAVLIIG